MSNYNQCSSNKILNPKTNRCVNRDGDIGRNILKDVELIYPSEIIMNTPHILDTINSYVDDTNTFNTFSRLNRDLYYLYQGDEFNHKMFMFDQVTIKYPSGETITNTVPSLYKSHVLKNKIIFIRNYENGVGLINEISNLRRQFIQYIQPPHKKLGIKFMSFIINSGNAKKFYAVEQMNVKLFDKKIDLPTWSTKINHNYVELAILGTEYNDFLSIRHFLHEKYISKTNLNPYFVLFILQLLWYTILDVYILSLQEISTEITNHKFRYERFEDIDVDNYKSIFVTKYNNMFRPMFLSSVGLSNNIDTSLKNDIFVMIQEIDELVELYKKSLIIEIRHAIDSDDDEDDDDMEDAKNYYHHDDEDEIFFDQTLREINRKKT